MALQLGLLSGQQYQLGNGLAFQALLLHALWYCVQNKTRHAVAGGTLVGSIWSVALTPDARRLMTASEDFTARVWDVLSGNCAHVLEGHTGWVVHIAATDDGQHCATASHDGTARSHF